MVCLMWWAGTGRGLLVSCSVSGDNWPSRLAWREVADQPQYTAGSESVKRTISH